MGYNKFLKKDGSVMLDLSGDNAMESDVRQGVRFHKANGESGIGTATFSTTESVPEWDGSLTITGGE